MDEEKISWYQEIISWFIHQETRRKSPGGGGGQKKLPGDNLPVQGEILLVSCRMDQEKISLYQEIISWFIHQETRIKSPGGWGDKKITER